MKKQKDWARESEKHPSEKENLPYIETNSLNLLKKHGVNFPLKPIAYNAEGQVIQ